MFDLFKNPKLNIGDVKMTEFDLPNNEIDLIIEKKDIIMFSFYYQKCKMLMINIMCH
jgi:hypothetical protein